MIVHRAPCLVGVDAGKSALDCWSSGRHRRVLNRAAEVCRFVEGLPPGSVVGVEATGRYHLLLAREAHARGHTVYVLNPLDCSRYRQALHGRGKTDRLDSEYVCRYLERERDSLRPWAPLPEAVERLRSLLGGRDALVSKRAQLRLAFSGRPECAAVAAAVLSAMTRAAKALDKDIAGVAGSLPGHGALRSVPCVGPVGAATLLGALTGREFRSADAFVAYCGLDCRPCDSGQKQGRRALSKRGPARLRKVLYMLAMTASRLPAWKPFYLAQLAKGMAKTQALVALSRKVAKAAWSVHAKGEAFCPEKVSKHNQALDMTT